MPVAPDLRLGRGPADEGIARRDRAVRPDADDLAEIVAEILRLVAGGEVVARGEEEIVIRRLHDAAAEMIAAGERPRMAKDHLDRFDAERAFVDEPSAGERRARASLRRLGVTEIDGVVLREATVEHDVEQTSLPGGENLRHAG